ncbi:MAG: hypothetical protein HC801_13955, partial [Nitrospira sp.]|nr:hypothetical protein [Nitrospira sp.]
MSSSQARPIWSTPFCNADQGAWSFTAWQYIPSDFSSGGGGGLAGSYFVLLNTYAIGSHPTSDWAVQIQIDSNDNMLKVFHGENFNRILVPYDDDRWMKIQVIVDIEEDWTRIYYDDDLVTEYSWTGGVFGSGGGAPDIAAVDLYANGSSGLYYDDLRLEKIDPPCGGALDSDVDIDGFRCSMNSSTAATPAIPTPMRTASSTAIDNCPNDPTAVAAEPGAEPEWMKRFQQIGMSEEKAPSPQSKSPTKTAGAPPRPPQSFHLSSSPGKFTATKPGPLRGMASAPSSPSSTRNAITASTTSSSFSAMSAPSSPVAAVGRPKVGSHSGEKPSWMQKLIQKKQGNDLPEEKQRSNKTPPWKQRERLKEEQARELRESLGLDMGVEEGAEDDEDTCSRVHRRYLVRRHDDESGRRWLGTEGRDTGDQVAAA